MVFASGAGAPETIFKLLYEFITEGLEAWIVNLGKESDNVSPVGVLLLACRRISGEEFAFFFVGENSKFPSFSIDSVLVLGPLARELKKGFRSRFSRRMELRMIIPDFQGDEAGGISKIPLQIRFAALCFLLGALLDLGRERAFEKGLVGGG